MELNLETNQFDAKRFERLSDSSKSAGGTDTKKKFDPKLYEQCEELEMFFLKTLVNSMRKTVDHAELTKPGFAGEMYEDMLWDERSKVFSKNAKFGFARILYEELTNEKGAMIDKSA